MSKLKAENCNRGQRQHGVAAKSKTAGWLTVPLLNAHDNDLRLKSNPNVCGLVNIKFKTCEPEQYTNLNHVGTSAHGCSSWLSAEFGLHHFVVQSISEVVINLASLFCFYFWLIRSFTDDQIFYRSYVYWQYFPLRSLASLYFMLQATCTYSWLTQRFDRLQ